MRAGVHAVPPAVALHGRRLRSRCNCAEVGRTCRWDDGVNGIEFAESNWLAAFNLGGSALFYLLVLSRWSERFSSDPFLTLPQILFPICSITWSYAITGPARGSVIAIMVVTILFGMFAALVMGATAVVVIRIGKLRARLAEQKRELADALALNQELATRDPLTGLLNRRAMVELLAREHARSVRGQGPLSIAVLDIDWFKRVNDSLGHGAGDEVLRRFATLVQSQLRTVDALARWGGEEFLLAMPGTTPDNALIVLERLRTAMARGGFDGIAPDLTITFSAGLVQLHACETQDAAIDRADRALYQAKRAGRDRVEAA